MHTAWTRVRVIGVVAALVVLPTACGGDDSDAESTESGDDSEVESTEPGDDSEAESTEPGDDSEAESTEPGEAASDGGDESSSGGTQATVRVALPSFGSEMFDPLAMDGAVYKDLLLPLYDTVIDVSPDGSFVEGLAEEWTNSEDGLTWTLKIREGAEFHGGWGEVTARDVVFSTERLIAATDSPEGPILDEMIETIEAPDDRTVVITTNGPQPRILWYFTPQASTGVVSEKYLTEEGGPDSESQRALQSEHPIGSGPFQFVSHTRGQKVVYETVDNHWRAQPAMETLEFLLVPEASTQIAMLISGEADIIGVTADDVQIVESAGFAVRSIPDRLSVGIFFPGTQRPAAEGKPASDAMVREALSYAIDRETILETVLGGYGSLSVVPYQTAPSSLGIDEDHYVDAAASWTYDPERSKQLLAEAGYPDGFDGTPQMFTFTMPGAAFLPVLAEIITAQWAEVGVTSPIVATEYGNYRPHLVRAELDDDYNAGDVNTMGQAVKQDALDVLQTWYWSQGVFGGFPAELDPLIEQAAVELDPQVQEDLISQAFDIVHDEWLIVPIFNVDTLYGVSDGVGDWVAPPGGAFTLGRALETIDQ